MNDAVIVAFVTQGTKDIYNGEDTKAARKTLPKELWAKAGRLFDLMDAAISVRDLAFPPGNRLESLKGDRKGQFSIRINDQYRIVFTFGTDARDVEIVDYH